MILEPTNIYNTKLFENKNRFIKYVREVEVEYLGKDTILLELIRKHAADKLRKLGYMFFHIGLITTTIKRLRRKTRKLWSFY